MTANLVLPPGVIPIRALREIYLEPFRIAQKNSDPWCYMTAYNRVNGTHVSESKAILEDILRKEWGFEGMVMSDWTGVYSCVESIQAGLDLEMPGPPVYRGAQALRSIHAGKLHEFEIDDRVRKVLALVKRAIDSGIAFNAKEDADNSSEVRALLRKAAADSIVLLKNEKQVLPITDNTKKIAVIGSNARTAVISGGGSAAMLPSYAISPLEGIKEAAKEIGAEVEYSIGAAEYNNLPPVHPLCTHPDGAKEGAIAKIEFWLENPGSGFETESSFKPPKPHHTINTQTANCLMVDGIPEDVSTGNPFIRYTTTFTPDTDGPWQFALASAGASNLFFDGKLIIDNSSDWQPGEIWFGMGSTERRQVVPSLQKGKQYKLEVRSWHREDLRGSPFKVAGAIRVGALPSFTPEQGIADAVKVAAEADTAIVVVGLNEDFESEGFDRKHMDLPGAADKLVAAVLAVNPNTIVVNQTGTPVAMPWADQASTVVQAFYGGNAVGYGLADVLFGKVNPSGKLSLTFPKRLADSPSDIGFGITSENTGKTIYTESIYVGYRYFEKAQLAPLFAFGHGKSYTTFAYSNLSVSSISDEAAFEVKFDVENTGKVAGREVAQVYIKDKESKLARAPKELKGFRKINLKPGQKETVTIKLDRDALKYWDDLHNRWTAEAGEFEVMVGGASDDTPLSASTKLEKTLTWTGL